MKMKEQGVITVYLSLMLVIVLGFLGGVLESSRYYGAYWNGTLATNSAIQSVFAGYDRQLLNNYGLLLLNGGFSEEFLQLSSIEEELETFINSYVTPSKGKILLSGGNFLSSKLKEVSIKKYYMITDNNGLYFRNTIVDYMKYEVASNIGQYLLEQIGIIKDGAKTKEEIDKKGEEGENVFESFFEENEKQRSLVMPLDEQSGEENVFIKLYQLLQKGYLNLVVPKEREVSEKQITHVELPSSQINKDNQFSIEADVSMVSEELLFNEYVLSYLSNFSDNKESGGLLYEQEYVIFGQDKDIDNLTSAINILMLIRIGLNGGYLLSDETLKGVAQSVGYIIATLVGAPNLGDAMTYFIIGLWATAEAVTDIDTLLSGKKVPLIKSKDSWNLDLGGIWAFITGDWEDYKERKEGSSYKDYLRMFLLFINSTEKHYRTMDMIQENMCEINPNFRFSNCIYSLEGKATFTVTPIFHTFGLLPIEEKNFTVSFGKTY